MFEMDEIKKRDLILYFPLFWLGIYFFYDCCNYYFTQITFANEFEKNTGISNGSHVIGVLVEQISWLYNPIFGFIGMLIFSGLPFLIFINYIKQQIKISE